MRLSFLSRLGQRYIHGPLVSVSTGFSAEVREGGKKK